MTTDELEQHAERMAICIESGVSEERAREIADEEVRRGKTIRRTDSLGRVPVRRSP